MNEKILAINTYDSVIKKYLKLLGSAITSIFFIFTSYHTFESMKSNLEVISVLLFISQILFVIIYIGVFIKNIYIIKQDT